MDARERPVRAGLGIAFAIAGTAITVTFLPAIWSAAAGVIAATWPILLIVAAIAALGVAFALAYDDVKAFLSGQDSLLGTLMERYGWFRAAINGLGVAFRASGASLAFSRIWEAGSALVNALVGDRRGLHAVFAPIFGLLWDIGVAVFRGIGEAFARMIGPVAPRDPRGVRAHGRGHQSRGRRVRWGVPAPSGVVGAGRSGASSGASIRRGAGNSSTCQSATINGPPRRASGIGQRQLASASGSPVRRGDQHERVERQPHEPHHAGQYGGSRSTRRADPGAVARSLNSTFGDAVWQFDDGMAR